MINRVEKDKKRPNLRWDQTLGKWIGWKVDIRIGHKRYRPVFKTKKEAEDFFTAARAKQAYARAGMTLTIPGQVPRLSELLNAHLAALTKKPEITRGKRIFREFAEILEFDVPVTEIRPAHFQKYINKRLATGVVGDTVNREITMLATAFNRSIEMFPDALADFTPPRIPRPRLKRGRKNRRIISESEMHSVVEFLMKGDIESITIARQFELAWYLGLRYGEVVKLLKSDFNEESGKLSVVRWKTDDLTVFEYLPERVIEILKAAISDSDSEHVFRHTAWIYRNSFYDTLKLAFEASGIPYGRGKTGAATFHNLRHSFITRMMQITDLATTREFSGHSDSAMVALYSHPSEQKKKDAMQKMYGNTERLELSEIYDKVRSGQMDIDAFIAALK